MNSADAYALVGATETRTRQSMPPVLRAAVVDLLLHQETRRKGRDDQVEKSLMEIEAKLFEAWRGNRCLTCPLAELSALAAATRTFYTENRTR